MNDSFVMDFDFFMLLKDLHIVLHMKSWTEYLQERIVINFFRNSDTFAPGCIQEQWKKYDYAFEKNQVVIIVIITWSTLPFTGGEGVGAVWETNKVF